MPQYFINREQISGGVCVLSGADFHHLANVRRARPGDKISLRCGAGELFEGEISKVGADFIEAKIISIFEEEKKITLALTLCAALIKGGAADDIVRRATEIGVKKIIPMITERTITGSRDKMNDKLGRWQRIAAEAAKQCLRDDIPLLGEVSSFKDLVKGIAGLKLIAHPEAVLRLNDISRPPDGGATLFIGPEGGFSQTEINIAEATGAIPVCFGTSHLRAETAGTVIPAIIIHNWGYTWT